jgi:IS4 transposase
MATSTSKDFGLRFFYFAFGCLIYSIWRAVDLLVSAPEFIRPCRALLQFGKPDEYIFKLHALARV